MRGCDAWGWMKPYGFWEHGLLMDGVREMVTRGITDKGKNSWGRATWSNGTNKTESMKNGKRKTQSLLCLSDQVTEILHTSAVIMITLLSLCFFAAQNLSLSCTKLNFSFCFLRMMFALKISQQPLAPRPPVHSPLWGCMNNAKEKAKTEALSTQTWVTLQMQLFCFVFFLMLFTL